MMVLKKLGSKFLRVEDIEEGDVVTVVGEPRYVPETESKFGKARYLVTGGTRQQEHERLDYEQYDLEQTS